MVDPYVLPHLEIITDDNLGFTVKVFGSYFPEDQPLYLDYRRTVRNITLSNGARGTYCAMVCLQSWNVMENCIIMSYHWFMTHLEKKRSISSHKRDFGEQKVVFFLSASYPFYESLLVGTKKAVFEKQHRSSLPSYDHPVLSFLNFNPGFFFFSSKAFSRIIFSIFLIAPK